MSGKLKEEKTCELSEQEEEYFLVSEGLRLAEQHQDFVNEAFGSD